MCQWKFFVLMYRANISESRLVSAPEISGMALAVRVDGVVSGAACRPTGSLIFILAVSFWISGGGSRERYEVPPRRHSMIFRWAGVRAMSPGEKSCRDAQGFSAARNPRANGPDRQIQDGCGFVVPHLAQTDEQDSRTLLLRKLVECSLEIAKLQTLALMRREW